MNKLLIALLLLLPLSATAATNLNIRDAFFQNNQASSLDRSTGVTEDRIGIACGFDEGTDHSSAQTGGITWGGVAGTFVTALSAVQGQTHHVEMYVWYESDFTSMSSDTITYTGTELDAWQVNLMQKDGIVANNESQTDASSGDATSVISNLDVTNGDLVAFCMDSTTSSAVTTQYTDSTDTATGVASDSRTTPAGVTYLSALEETGTTADNTYTMTMNASEDMVAIGLSMTTSSATLTCATDPVDADGGSTVCTASAGIGGTAAQCFLTADSGTTWDNFAGTSGSTTALTCTFALTQFEATGALDNQPLDTAINIKICDDASQTNCSAEDTITLTGPNATDKWSGTVGSTIAGDSVLPTAAVTGDDYLCDSSVANVEVNDAGAPALSALTATSNCKIFDVSATPDEWSSVRTVTYGVETTAPVLSGLSVTRSGGNSLELDVSLTTDTAEGTVYFYPSQDPATPSTATCETATETKSATSFDVVYSNLTVPQAGVWFVHVCQEDLGGNDSNVLSSSASVGGSVNVELNCPRHKRNRISATFPPPFGEAICKIDTSTPDP